MRSAERGPLPCGLILGRTLNTLRATRYEKDGTVTEPRYVWQVREGRHPRTSAGYKKLGEAAAIADTVAGRPGVTMSDRCG